MAITIDNLTTAEIDGTGVFDILMKANKAHLDQEYSKNRIKGSEYATVYLGSLQSVLQTAVAFLLEKDKLALEVELLEQQVLVAQAEVAKANATVLQIQAQTALVTQQAANAVLERDILAAQEDKIRAEIELLTLNEAKTAQETQLLLWKTNTEKGQTTSAGVEDNSVIGKQKLLYKAQTDGFTRDAEQKAAKVLVDTWNVRRTTDEATIATDTGTTPNYLGDRTVGRAITKLLSGVGVTTT
jgi:hypothetical protein